MNFEALYAHFRGSGIGDERVESVLQAAIVLIINEAGQFERRRQLMQSVLSAEDMMAINNAVIDARLNVSQLSRIPTQVIAQVVDRAFSGIPLR